METTEAYERIREFVAKELLDGDDKELNAETPLLAWGIIDSMSLLRLTEFIEEDLHVAIPSEELADSTNLQNLGTIAAMVVKHARP